VSKNGYLAFLSTGAEFPALPLKLLKNPPLQTTKISLIYFRRWILAKPLDFIRILLYIYTRYIITVKN